MVHAADTVTIGEPRTAEDARFLARFDRQIELPLVLAAVLPLVLVPGGTYNALAIAVNIVAWFVFVVDLVVHERRLVHYLRSWVGRFDLTVVVLTAPWFLVLGPSESKFVLLIRLARIARLAMATKGARRLLQRLGKVALVAAGVVVLGAAVAYHAEHPTNPGFATYGDALWWGIVTLTTVGYGDIVPKTTTGRAAGIMIMFTGVAVLGVLAGSLASFFRLERPSPGDAPPVSPAMSDTAQPDPLTIELAALRADLARMQKTLGHLVPPETDDGDSPAP